MDEEVWTAADEWGSWMFPRAHLPPAFRRPLHERIQEYIDQVNPQTAVGRDAWMPLLRVSTPGDGADLSGSRITDFGTTVDRDLETADDLSDAARMYLAGLEYSLKTEAIDEATRQAAARDQADLADPDWEKMAEDLERNGPDFCEAELHIHPSAFPGEARTLAEADALVGGRPEHETLEEMPGPCILCGEDEVHVTVERNPDGEIEETTLKCEECGWRVTGGPLRFDEADRLERPDGEVDWNF